MKTNLKELIFSAMLSALAIIIPISFSFFRISVGDAASFTLAAHIPLFIAMFISPQSALIVALATTLGFFFSSGIIIVARAFSHILWAVPGAFILKRNQGIMTSIPKSLLFNFILAVVHAVIETLVILAFFIYQPSDVGNVFIFFFLIVGVGGVIHSMVDFALAQIIFKRANIEAIIMK